MDTLGNGSLCTMHGEENLCLAGSRPTKRCDAHDAIPPRKTTSNCQVRCTARVPSPPDFCDWTKPRGVSCVDVPRCRVQVQLGAAHMPTLVTPAKARKGREGQTEGPAGSKKHDIRSTSPRTPSHGSASPDLPTIHVPRGQFSQNHHQIARIHISTLLLQYRSRNGCYQDHLEGGQWPNPQSR